MLFYVNSKKLTLEVRNNPLDVLTKLEVVIDGKRKNRRTASTFWTDDFDAAREHLDKAVFERRKAISSEIIALESEQNSLEPAFIEELNKAREEIREANNDIFN